MQLYQIVNAIKKGTLPPPRYRSLLIVIDRKLFIYNNYLGHIRLVLVVIERPNSRLYDG